MDSPPRITTRQFIDVAQSRFGIHLRTRTWDANGNPHIAHGLEKPHPSGGVLWYPLVMGEDEYLTTSQIKDACRALEIGVDDLTLSLSSPDLSVTGRGGAGGLPAPPLCCLEPYLSHLGLAAGLGGRGGAEAEPAEEVPQRGFLP